MANSKPYVILSTAISIDGKISTRTGDSKLSSSEDFVRLHKLRSKVDGIILDSKGEIPSKSKILQTSKEIPTIIAVSKNITKSNLEKLKKFPVEIVITGQKSVNIKSLLKKLASKNMNTLLVEGGGTINWEFIKKNLFDEMIITLSPYLIGGNNAISFVEGMGFDKISKSPQLRLKSIKRLKNHLVLNYLKV